MYLKFHSNFDGVNILRVMDKILTQIEPVVSCRLEINVNRRGRQPFFSRIVARQGSS